MTAMLEQQSMELDELIQEEKRLVAIEIFKEAWLTAKTEGIETEILAESAVYTAMSELVSHFGEQNTADFIKTLDKQLAHGEFTANKTIQ